MAAVPSQRSFFRRLAGGATLGDVQAAIEKIVGEEICNIGAITQRLARGELTVC